MIRTAGTYEQISTVGETVNAFVPAPLPPRNPPLKKDADRTKLLAGRATSVPGIRLFELLPAHPIITVAGAVKLLETTKPTATKAVSGLVGAGILVETTGRRRDRSFSYEAYLNILRAGTETE